MQTADNPTPQCNAARRRLLVSTVSLLTCPVWAANSLEVVHQGPESVDDRRSDYYWELLDAALKRTTARWGGYQIHTGPMMNALRAVQQMQSNNLDLVARATSRQIETTLRPIRIPLDKGLLGYRVFLICRELQARMDKVHTLDNLRQFSIGQGEYWEDVNILQRGGFKVVTGDRYEGLFSMLAARRFDLFGRSVTEVTGELETRQAQYPDLAIEKNLLLYYPLPRYFFVRRDAAGEQLALRIEQGLQMMIQDGSFDKMFNARKAPFEKALNLKQRRLLWLPNPLLPPETPFDKSNLWYVPEFDGNVFSRIGSGS